MPAATIFAKWGGAEDGRSCLNYDVAGLGEDTVDCVPADELFDFVGVDDFAGFGFAARYLYGVCKNFLSPLLGFVVEEIAECDKLNVLVGGNHIACRTRAAIATADEPYFDSVVALDLSETKAGQSRRRTEYCTAFYEASSVHNNCIIEILGEHNRHGVREKIFPIKGNKRTRVCS